MSILHWNWLCWELVSCLPPTVNGVECRLIACYLLLVHVSYCNSHHHCFYFLARSANLPEGLYILLVLISFFLEKYFNDFSETNYLKIRWTDFHNLYIEWKRFGCRWLIWTLFFDVSREVAMATDFVQKLRKIAYPLHLSLCHSAVSYTHLTLPTIYSV